MSRFFRNATAIILAVHTDDLRGDAQAMLAVVLTFLIAANLIAWSA